MIKVKVKQWQGPKYDWEIRIRVQLPTGEWLPEVKRGFCGTNKQAERHGGNIGFRLVEEATATAEAQEVSERKSKEVPTLAEFESSFIEQSLVANRRKPTTIDTYKYRLKLYLVPELGHLRLDEITTKSIIAFKARPKIAKLGKSTVNAILGVLSSLLNFAVDCEVIDRSPLRFKLVKLKAMKPKMAFYEDHQFEALVDAARSLDDRYLAIVLLGGEAGLRRGEIAGLEWSDVDLKRRQLTVRRSRYQGQVTSPKGNTERTVKMTTRLAASLEAIKDEKAPTVLVADDGGPFTESKVNDMMLPVTKAAGLQQSRKIHVLRHTFCSTLATRGAPATAIQALAGHSDLSTTQRYMHLSPAARDSAIMLLEKPTPATVPGRIVEESAVA